MHFVVGVVLAAGSVTLFALGLRGALFPLLPRQITHRWVENAIPIGTAYDRVRVIVRERGWRESSGTWSCPTTPPSRDAFMSVELGHIIVGLPLVKYSFAHLTFGPDCRLREIEVVTDIDGP